MVKLFSDISLSVLGRPRETYLDYTMRIQQEYQFATKEQYIETRQIVLNKFLQRERIFYSDLLFNEYEENARENIKWELGHLKRVGPVRRDSAELTEEQLAQIVEMQKKES